MNEVEKIYKCSECGFKGTFKEVSENKDCIVNCKPKERRIELSVGLEVSDPEYKPFELDPKIKEIQEAREKEEGLKAANVIELHIQIDKNVSPYAPKILKSPEYIEDWALLNRVFNIYCDNLIRIAVRPPQSNIIKPGAQANQMIRNLKASNILKR